MRQAVSTTSTGDARTRPASSVLISRACDLLGVSRRTVYYWISTGRLGTVRTLGGSQRVLLADIARQRARRLEPAGDRA